MSNTMYRAAMLATVVGSCALPAFAKAAVVASGVDGRTHVTAKDGTTRELEAYPKPDKKNQAQGKVSTYFDFHDPRTGNTDFIKYCDKGKESVDTPKARHEYKLGEKHDTVGAVDYKLWLGVVQIPDPKHAGKFIDRLTTRASAYGEVIPGSKGLGGGKVEITAQLTDPFLFSDDNDEANYKSFEQGMDMSFDVDTSTFFPTNLGPDGSLASSMYKSWTGRVAPGLVSDPTTFWNLSAPPGAIDLYSLTLSIDSTHMVHADLAFGASNSFFTVDVRDAMGNLIDTSDPSAIESLELAIEASFVGGGLVTPISGLFTTGFVPTSAAAGDYSVGSAMSDRFAGLEPIPAPTAMGLFGAGVLMVASRRRA